MAERETTPRARIVLVDDDAEFLQLVAFVLSPWADAVLVSDSARAVEVSRATMPDLILLDMRMPGLDGFDVIDELKQDTTLRHIPVIFITGEATADIESACLEAGAADYISKPINPRVLTARARTHVQLKQHGDVLSELAFRDGLTSTWNRGAFDDRLVAESLEADRSHRPLALLLVDVDHLTAYNATYGHLAGDDVLRAVARAIAKAAHLPRDIVARFDGGRFAVLLPDHDEASAAATARRVIEAVAALGLRHTGAGETGRVTVSIGVAATRQPAGDAGQSSAAELVAHAQAALRRAKSGGGSRLAVSG